MQELQYLIAGCRLDQRRTHGVAELLSGLSADTLAKVEPGYGWEGRLAYERGRLLFHVGDVVAARRELRLAANRIADWRQKDASFEVHVAGALKKMLGP
jgi:non-specific serine/threonine protein kinase